MVYTSSTACTFPWSDAMAKRGGKTCAAGGPGQISCTNHTYSPGISMYVFPSNKKVRTQWDTFLRTHRPDFQLTEYSALCATARVVSRVSD